MSVHLGFTVPDAEPFFLPLHHIIVSGMTIISGKTTTVEAILRRRKGKSLVFLTKRGEKTFKDAWQIQPYYRERFDWEYVRGLLEAAFKEKLKFETPWIIRICKRASSLEDVREELRRRLEDDESGRKKLRDLDKNQYTLLAAYMDKILPALKNARARISVTLDFHEGLNVMDLTDWYDNEVFQMVIIRSCMEWILAHENNVVVALPEAWKMLPQGRNTPVKLYFEKFIREGATNGNFLILDAQDLGGVDKTPLRNVSLWIIGKMMEANEIERLLKQMFRIKISPDEIQTLPLGHFFVADGVNNIVKKIYVWPHNVPDHLAISVARGELSPEVVKDWIQKKNEQALPNVDLTELKKRLLVIEDEQGKSQDVVFSAISKVSQKVEVLDKRLEGLEQLVATHLKAGHLRVEEIDRRFDRFLGIIKERTGIPSPLQIEQEETPVIISHVEAEPQKVSTRTVLGKVLYTALVDIKGEFMEADLSEKMLERGWNISHSTLAPSLGNLVKQGDLIRINGKPAKYRLPCKKKFDVQGARDEEQERQLSR